MREGESLTLIRLLACLGAILAWHAGVGGLSTTKKAVAYVQRIMEET